MTAPRVTVIVPSYNHERFVAETIASVVAQTYDAWRLIVIDDGSKDRSREILRPLAKQHGFELIEQENRGQARTLNRGLELADTDYVAFLASDDTFEPDRLAQQVAFLDANPELAMTWGDAWKIDEHGQRIGRMIGTNARGMLFDDALMGRLSVPPQAALWRRSALVAVGHFDPTVRSEDIWLLWSVARRYPIAYLPGVFGSYRHHGAQASRDSRLMVAEAQRVLRQFADAPVFAAAWRRQELHWFFALSRQHRRDALRYLPGAAHQPTSPLFWGGVLGLVGLGGARAPYRTVRDWVRERRGTRVR